MAEFSDPLLKSQNDISNHNDTNLKHIVNIKSSNKSYIGFESTLFKATGVPILSGTACEGVRLEMPAAVVGEEFTTGVADDPEIVIGALTTGVTRTGLEAVPDDATVVDAFSVDESGVADPSTIFDCFSSVAATISVCDP